MGGIRSRVPDHFLDFGSPPSRGEATVVEMTLTSVVHGLRNSETQHPSHSHKGEWEMIKIYPYGRDDMKGIPQDLV
jgi:hypothetical protein